MTTRLAVLGSPIAHSKSPALHRAAYGALGLDWTYEAVEVRDGALEPFLAGLDASWRGLSLTMPLKREVLPHVPDAFVAEDVRDEKDGEVGKVGYEINFNRYFYVYKAPRPPHVIAEEIREMEKRFLELMKGVLA